MRERESASESESVIEKGVFSCASPLASHARAHADGNDVATSGKLTLRTPPHLGKRDIIEYLRKVYGLRARKVNSMNYPGKLKRGVLPRAHGQKTYRTKAFKKCV